MFQTMCTTQIVGDWLSFCKWKIKPQSAMRYNKWLLIIIIEFFLTFWVKSILNKSICVYVLHSRISLQTSLLVINLFDIFWNVNEKKYISKLVYLLQGKSQVYLKYDEVQELINSKVACIELSKNTGIVLQKQCLKIKIVIMSSMMIMSYLVFREIALPVWN